MHIALDCIVVGRYPSGVERAVSGLLEGVTTLDAADHRISILLSRDFEPPVPTGSQFDVIVAPAWTRLRLGRVLYEQAVLPGLLRSVHADVVHGAAYVLPLQWEGTSVVTIHDTVTLTHPGWCKPLNVWHYRTVMTRSARRASTVVVPSRHVQQTVVEHIGVDEARTRIVPLGVSHEFQPAKAETVAALRKRYKLPKRYLLSVGNLEPRKNLLAIIQAFEAFAPQAPHSLVLAGKRGWRCGPIFRAMRESPLAKRIAWLGYVPPEDLPALYSGAEVLVQWSLDEGFGLPPLEAMACGTAAVVSDGGALPEVTGGAALVVPLSAGPEGLAEELSCLARNGELRRKLIERGRAHAAQFTWRHYADRMMHLYEEVGRESPR